MKEDLAIDPHRLEEEWMRQPLLYEKYAEISREADEKLQQAKDRLEQVKAELDGKIRKNFESYGMKKVVEGAVTNTILIQEEYTDAAAMIAEARANSLKAKNMVTSLDQKKYALQNLVELWKGQYFSTPKEGKEIEGGSRFLEEIEESQNNQSNDLRAKFKKKRKK